MLAPRFESPTSETLVGDGSCDTIKALTPIDLLTPYINKQQEQTIGELAGDKVSDTLSIVL